MNFYSFTMNNIEGQPVSLGRYQGKALLLVNVASLCGYTTQYKGLQQLYEKYQGRGLEILGFPANDFAKEEPGTDAEIRQFCSSKYQVSFPLFSKIEVTGPNMHPLYKYLTSQSNFKGDVEWNFGKFLLDRQGEVVARFKPRTEPDDVNLLKVLEQTLAI
jgi:glutathione peroxidase